MTTADQEHGWAHLRDQILSTPERRARYEHTRNTVIQTRRLLKSIDAERERLGLSKSALANLVGADPSVIRRMFSSETSNPTLQTTMALAEALGLEITIKAPRKSKRAPASPPSNQSGTSAA